MLPIRDVIAEASGDAAAAAGGVAMAGIVDQNEAETEVAIAV